MGKSSIIHYFINVIQYMFSKICDVQDHKSIQYPTDKFKSLFLGVCK